MSSVIQQNALGYIKIKLGREFQTRQATKHNMQHTQYNMRHLSANDSNKMRLHEVA